MAAEFDLIVLGSGLSGLAMALAAQARGLRPLLLEKAPTLGGGSVDSYGLLWVGANHLAAGAGIKDDLEKTRDYVRFLAGGEAAEARLAAFVEDSPAALRFFESRGVPFRLVRGVPDHYFGLAPGALREGRTLETALTEGPVNPDGRDRVRLPDQPYSMTFEEQMSWGGLNNLSGVNRSLYEARRTKDVRGKGVGMVSHFARLLFEAKVPVTTGVSTRELIVKGGRVTGVVTARGRKLEASRGVVLATGGYESDAGMVEAYERIPDWLPPTPPELTGDGLLLGEGAGGATLTIRNNLLLFLGIPVPAAEPGGRQRFHPAYLEELCSPHTMVVNRFGRRFGDETSFQMLVPSLRRFDAATHAYANLPAYLIFDQQYAEANSLAGGPKGGAIPPYVARSRTIRGLARKLGIDAAGLAATLERFNRSAEAGSDEDFQRGELAFRFARDKQPTRRNTRLGAVERPPFYGVRLCTSGYGSAGLLTDERARVLNRQGRPIPGLYALGNTSAHNEFGVGYQAGFTHTSSITFAYLAAEEMRGRRARRGA